MTPEEISMVQECTSSYIASENPDGTLTIKIEVPARFAELWLVKLSELKATTDDLTNGEQETGTGKAPG